MCFTKLKYPTTTIFFSALISFLLLIIISSCGPRDSDVEAVNEPLAQKEMQEHFTKFYIDGKVFKLEGLSFSRWGSIKKGIVSGKLVDMIRETNYFRPLDKASEKYFLEILNQNQ